MTDNQHMTRRDMLAQTLPAAALGAGLLSTLAYAQPGGAVQGKPGAVERAMAEAFANGQYQLPKLPYEYDALEPHIDAKTVQLHHDKHHKAYVDGLNKAIKGLADLRQAGGEIDMPKLYGLERDLSFNGGGHLLHTLFWSTMGAKAGGAPQGALAEVIDASFGSFDAFKAYFSKVAAGIKGSGWALLAYEPVGHTLAVYGINEHDAHLVPGSIVLLPLDVWEHAYYLKYQNARADFIAAWWNVVNWAAVGEFFERVQAGHKQMGGK